jgi:hypothetical protein
VIGAVPNQVPLLAVNLFFLLSLPLIVGRTVLAGFVAVGARLPTAGAPILPINGDVSELLNGPWHASPLQLGVGVGAGKPPSIRAS